MKNQRGNILITALFMAIFLFFLCVAIVSQNRMNISLGLSVDHRLKAESAARSGITSALETMRNDPDWPKALSGLETELKSGASFTISVEPYPSPDESPYLLKLVSTGVSGIVKAEHWAIIEEVRLPTGADGSGTPYLFTKTQDRQLVAAGTDFQWHDMGELPNPKSPLAAAEGPLFVFDKPGSGVPAPAFVDFVRLFIPEENGQLKEIQGPPFIIELAPAGESLLYLDVQGDKANWVEIPDPGPQLGRAGSKLTVIADDPTLKDIPRISLTGGGKENLYNSKKWDRRSVRVWGGQMVGSRVELQKAQFKSQKLNEDSFENQELQVIDSPWPRGYYIAEFEPSTAYANGEMPVFKQYDNAGYIKFEQYDDAGYKPFSLDDLTGPQNFLEWYSLDGTALSAHGRKVSCHGTHYFYGTFKMDDLGWPEPGDSAADSLIYKRPCVLQYDLDTEKWTILADFMRVSDISVPPDVFRCPDLEKSSLGVDSKGVSYVFTDETDRYRAIALEGKDFRHVRGDNAVVKKVVLYQDKPYYFRQTALWNESLNSFRVSLQGLTADRSIDPNAKLGQNRPAVMASVLEPTEADSGEIVLAPEKAQVRPAEVLEYGFQAHGRDVTSLGDSLIASTYLRRSVPKFDSDTTKGVGVWNSSLKTRKVLTFTHFDGKHWQVWPSGPDDLLRTQVKDKEGTLVELRGATGKQMILEPKNLALARYDTGFKVGGHFAVLASGKGSGPMDKKLLE